MRSTGAIRRCGPRTQRFPFLVVWDDHEVDNNYAGLISGGRRPGRTVRAAPRGRATRRSTSTCRCGALDSQGRAASALPPVHVRHAGEYLDARHAAVPDRSAVRRQRAAALRRHDGPASDDAGRGAGKVADGSPRPIDGGMELPGPADSDGQARSVCRARSAGFRWTSGTATSRAGRGCCNSSARESRRNPVTLAGDVHNNWVNDIRLNVDDPKTPVVASEFVGTSITSTGDGSEMSPLMKAMVSENECVRFANDQRGYVRFDVKPKELRADFRVVEYVTKPGAPVKTRASFVVEDGRPGAKESLSTIRSHSSFERIVSRRAGRRADTSSPRFPGRLPFYGGRRGSTIPSCPRSPAQSHGLRSSCPSRLPTSRAEPARVLGCESCCASVERNSSSVIFFAEH